MSDIITSIQQFPTLISVVEQPLNVIVAQGGIQGPPGTGGGGGGGGGTGIFSGVINNITSINSGSGFFIFQTNIVSGVSGQFISFPTNLGYNPLVVNSLQNNSLNNILLYQIYGTTPTGFNIIFSDVINDTGYFINTFAAPSTGTGLATIVIPSNVNGNSIAQNVISQNNLNLISNNNNTGIIISGGNLNIYGNTSGVGPQTTNFSLFSDGIIYGGLSGVLGSPVGWLPLYISGTLRYIPYF